MIRYNLTTKDALRVSMARIPAAEVTFYDPCLDIFFADEQEGLCTIEVVKIRDLLTKTTPRYIYQNELQIKYHDPEVEMIKRLSC